MKIWYRNSTPFGNSIFPSKKFKLLQKAAFAFKQNLIFIANSARENVWSQKTQGVASN